MGAAAEAPSAVITLPTGGGALHGIGEKFAPDLHTGTATFTIPIQVPAGRNGFQPQLNLVYSSASGNGLFGLGWSLDIPAVTRKTSKGVPRYDDQDVFILAGSEDLVPVAAGPPGVVRYRPRTESLFARIEHVSAGADDYWEVRTRDGLRSRYGTPTPSPAPAGWADPALTRNHVDPGRSIFAWHLTETRDLFGNLIQYRYGLRDAGQDGPHTWDQPLLTEVAYVDYDGAAGQEFLVRLRLAYEDAPRPDPFSGYRAGFEQRTTRRCARVRIETHADAVRPVREYHFAYQPDASNGASLLTSVTLVGFDDQGTLVDELPPLDFGYTRFAPATRRTFGPIEGNELPARSLASRDLELVDLFGQGLPDILEMNGSVRYWRNLGHGRFDVPRPMRDAPAGLSLADPGVQLLDADGDGRSDLLVTTPGLAGYFPLRFGGLWDRASFRAYRQAPSFNLDDPEVALVDLDGDGVTDAIRSGAALECFFNDPDRGWHETRRVERRALDGFPNVSFSDPRVRWADMTGDGLTDVVLVHDGNVEYWPNLGRGRWGRRVHMQLSPRFPSGYDPRRILLGDVDGDGLADLVYVDNGSVSVWLNQSGNGWSSQPVVIAGTPPVADVDAVRLVDLLGSGIAGVLWSSDAPAAGRPHLWFLDCTGGRKPYLLDQMDNHLGALSTIQYAPSTEFFMADEDEPRSRWRTPLPLPVQVVQRVEVADQLSGGKLVSEYRYHHGYWDGVEREFRGFGMVEQFDSETFGAANPSTSAPPSAPVARQHFSPPTLTRTWFHQGPVGDDHADWQELDYTGEYWPGDPQLLDHARKIDAFLASFPPSPESRAAKRDALRALQGSMLRTELYACDGSARQSRPYTVTEASYGLLEVEPPAADSPPRRRVYYPHATAQRTTRWERGDDPMTQFSYTRYTDAAGAFDQLGRPRAQTRIACPRGWRTMTDSPLDGYLATRVCTSYAGPTDPQLYVQDRVATQATYELRATSGTHVQDLVTLPDAHPSLHVVEHTRSFYDGQAFVGLPLGQVGQFGAVVRTESLVLTEDVLQAAYPDLPPYFEPSGQPTWSPEYPAEFRGLASPAAGYAFHSGSGDLADPRGYFVTTDRRRYDFQTGPPTPVRGLVLETLDPLRDTSADPSGHRTLIDYDAYQLLPTQVTDGAGLTTRAVYNYRALQPAEVTDANGNPRAFRYSPLGLLASSATQGKTPAEGDQARPGVRLEYGYQAFANSPPERRRPIWVRTISQVHHDMEVEVPLPQRDQTMTTLHYSDGFGRLLQTRTQAGAVRLGDESFGGGDGVLPAAQGDGPGGDVVGRRNANALQPNVLVSGWQTYDNKGRVVEKYEPYFATGWDYDSPDDHQTGSATVLFYDPRGQLLRTVNADGSEQRLVPGVPGTIAAPDLTTPDLFEPTPWEAYTYDPNDNAGRTHPGSAGAYRHHWDTPGSVLVDALGRTIEAVARNRDAPAAPGDPLPPIQALHTRTAYDSRGNVRSVTDALGRPAFQAVYDLANRSVRLDSIDAGWRTMVVNAMGDVVEQRDAKGALVLCGFDALSRPTRLWARDAADEPVTLRQRLEYGDAGSAAQAAAERDDQRSANRLGRLYQQFDEAGLVTFTAYDFKGNPLERARTVVSNDALLGAFAGPLPGWQVAAFRVDWTNPAAVPLESGTYVTTASFDALNRITRVSYPEDVEHERRALKPSYDEAGRLEQLMLERTDAAGPTSDTFVQRIAYDAGGRRVLVAYGNGLMTRYAYDPRSLRLLRLRTEAYEQPADLTYRRTGPVRQDVAYEYDLVGNVLTMEEHTPDCGIPGSPQGQDALQRKFVCDALSRLRSATGRECDLPPDVPWDDTPRCVDLTRTRAYQETYVYDAAGNLQQLKHLVNGGGFTRGFNLSPGTNRLDSLAVGAAPTGYTYDASGNMTRETTSRHFEWDYADRMRVYRTQVDGSEPSVHAQYLYDVAGQRVKKLVRKQGGRVEVTVSIDGLFEHQQVIEAGGTEENNTLHVLDEQARIATVRVGAPFTQDATPAVKYHLNDHLGSSTVVVDDTGTPINREEYTPYGETSFGSFARKRYRFTGKERDEESGLYYHGARYYLPWLARWATCDPAGPAATQNAYAYAANPLAFVDPRGMEPRCVTRYTNESPLPSEGNPHPLQIEGSITICKPPAGGRASTTAAPDATPQPEALPNLPPPPAQPETVQTVQETVITGEIPFEPEVSYGPALEAAQGRGHIEMGDVAQFGKGLYHGVIEAASILFGPLLGSVIEHNAPRMAVDPRYAGAEMMGRQLGENLSYEATAGVGLIASKGLKATEAIGATLSKSKALSTATGSGRAYSVAVEVELQSVWGPGIPNELRRNLHRIEAQELIAEQVQKLLKSADPVERKAGRQLVKLLADPSEWNVHHDAFRQGMMQLVPRAQHYARELQDLLHPYIIPFVRRVGGFAIWGHLY